MWLKYLAKKCLEMLAEIAELKDDYTESYEQLGKCLNLGNREDSAIRAKIAEPLRLSASVLEDEQLNLKEYVDRMKGEFEIYSIFGESIAAVSSFFILGILREKSLEEKAQKTVEVQQVQYVDKSIDVPGRQIQEKLVEMIHLILQERISERIGDKLALRIQETLLEVIRFIRREQNSERFVETFMNAPIPQNQDRPVEGDTFSEYTDAVRTEKTSQNQSLKENTLHSSSEQCTRSSAVTWVRQTSKSETHVGSCSVSNVERSLTGKCPVSMYQDEDETNEAKVEATKGLEDSRATARNAATEGQLGFKFEAGDKEKTDEAVQHACDWLDKNKLAENDEFEAQHKELDRADRVINVPVATQHQVPAVQRVETTVGGPKVQFIDEVMNVPTVKQRRVSTAMQTARKTDQTVEVARVIPHERILKPERASVRKRVRQFEMNGDMSCTSTVEAPRATPGDKQSEDPEDEAPNKRRKQESDPDSHAPVHFSLCNGSSDQGTKSVDDSAELETRFRGVPVGQLDDVLLEVRDVKSELLQVRELVGVLVRRERCAEVKTEVAARRLDRMEREKDDADDAEREANLQEALTDQSKVVKLIVDKWFVDKGFGFGTAETGEIVFIHASVVQGAKVLMVGTHAWAQVVNDHARAEGSYRARRA